MPIRDLGRYDSAVQRMQGLHTLVGSDRSPVHQIRQLSHELYRVRPTGFRIPVLTHPLQPIGKVKEKGDTNVQ